MIFLPPAPYQFESAGVKQEKRFICILSALIDCLMARDIIRRRGHHSSVLHPG
jgi:hypothetical protein